MKDEKGWKVRAPLATQKKQLASAENTSKIKKQVRKNLAHLAHSGLSENAPGGTHSQEQMQKQVTICTSGERWYVSYYQNETRKRIYGGINAEKDLNIRMQKLLQLQIKVFNFLLAKQDPMEKSIPATITIYKSIDIMIADKRRYLKKNSIKNVIQHLGDFKEWLINTNNEHRHPSEFKRQDMIGYRNSLLEKGIGNRTVNNMMSEVSVFFNYFIDSDGTVPFKNPLYKLKRLPSRSETHVAYTTDQFQKMIDYMKEKDTKLLFFVKLIAFAYLRSDEAKFLRIRDIDLPARKILLTAKANKTNRRTHKIIQELIVDEFEKRNLDQYPEDYFLFSHGMLPGKIPVGENYFRKKFRKVKIKFGLTKLHTIYGFRHTSVQQLLEAGTKWHKAMDLTDHNDMASFQKYARNILGRDPEDHSTAYKVNL